MQIGARAASESQVSLFLPLARLYFRTRTIVDSETHKGKDDFVRAESREIIKPAPGHAKSGLGSDLRSLNFLSERRALCSTVSHELPLGHRPLSEFCKIVCLSWVLASAFETSTEGESERGERESEKKEEEKCRCWPVIKPLACKLSFHVPRRPILQFNLRVSRSHDSGSLAGIRIV